MKYYHKETLEKMGLLRMKPSTRTEHYWDPSIFCRYSITKSNYVYCTNYIGKGLKTKKSKRVDCYKHVVNDVKTRRKYSELYKNWKNMSLLWISRKKQDGLFKKCPEDLLKIIEKFSKPSQTIIVNQQNKNKTINKYLKAGYTISEENKSIKMHGEFLKDPKLKKFTKYMEKNIIISDKSCDTDDELSVMDEEEDSSLSDSEYIL